MNNKEILDFNLWHGTELVMGQVAHFDTYLDMCFLSLVLKCEMWGLVGVGGSWREGGSWGEVLGGRGGVLWRGCRACDPSDTASDPVTACCPDDR